MVQQKSITVTTFLHKESIAVSYPHIHWTSYVLPYVPIPLFWYAVLILCSDFQVRIYIVVNPLFRFSIYCYRKENRPLSWMRLSLPSWLLPVFPIWPPALLRQTGALPIAARYVTAVCWLQVYPFAVSNHGSIGPLSYAVLPSHVHHVASYISPSLLRNCRDRQRVSHVSVHYWHTGVRYWLSCSRSVFLPSAFSWLSVLSCYYRYNRGCVLIISRFIFLPILRFRMICLICHPALWGSYPISVQLSLHILGWSQCSYALKYGWHSR